MSKATIDGKLVTATWQAYFNEIMRQGDDPHGIAAMDVALQFYESAKATAPADEPRVSEAREHLAWLRKTAGSYVDNIRIVGFEDCLRIFMAPSVESDASPRKDEVSMATHATEAKATAPSTSDEMDTEQLVELPYHFCIKPGLHGVKEEYRCRGIDDSPSTSDPRANCPWKCRLGAPKCTCAQPPDQQPAGTPTRWECFCDASYYHYWAVRQAGETRWGHCFHVVSKSEAEGLRDLLNLLSATQTKEGTDDE